jgi:xanthine/uracil permease
MSGGYTDSGKVWTQAKEATGAAAIIVCERWGPPILKSCSVIVGLLVGSIVAAACN